MPFPPFCSRHALLKAVVPGVSHLEIDPRGNFCVLQRKLLCHKTVLAQNKTLADKNGIYQEDGLIDSHKPSLGCACRGSGVTVGVCCKVRSCQFKEQ